MIALLSLVTGWKGYAASALVGVVLAAAAVIWIDGLRLDAVRADLRAAKDRIAILDASNQQCASDVQASNTAVDALKLAAATREAVAAAAVAAAEGRARASDKRAAVLASIKPASDDDCKAAAIFAADYFKGRAQ